MRSDLRFYIPASHCMDLCEYSGRKKEGVKTVGEKQKVLVKLCKVFLRRNCL